MPKQRTLIFCGAYVCTVCVLDRYIGYSILFIFICFHTHNVCKALSPKTLIVKAGIGPVDEATLFEQVVLTEDSLNRELRLPPIYPGGTLEIAMHKQELVTDVAKESSACT